MRILQVVHGFPPKKIGGTEILTYNISFELAKKHDVFIFYPIKDLNKPNYCVIQKKINNLIIYEINNQKNSFDYINADIDAQFQKILFEINPDIVHFQHLITLSAHLIEITKSYGIPSIVTLHDYWFICKEKFLLTRDNKLCSMPDRGSKKCIECLNSRYKPLIKLLFPMTKLILKHRIDCNYKSRYLKNLERIFRNIIHRNEYLLKSLNLADKILTVSKFQREMFIKYGVNENKIFHICYGMDISWQEQVKKKKTQKIRFGYLGNMNEIKGFHILARAFSKITDKNAALIIYGENQMPKKYQDILKQMSHDNRIEIHNSRFNQEDIASIYSNIDILVFPSIVYEGSPLTIHEAFIAKTPVITSNIGGMAELIDHKKNGLLFQVNDSEDLYRKMMMIINDPLLIDTFKKNIKPIKIIGDYALELEKIYEETMKIGDTIRHTN